MTYKFTIPGTLPGLNEYINAERTNKYKAAKIKKDTETTIMLAAKLAHPKLKIRNPVMLRYLWVEKTKRRDKDNICFAQKFVQDSLVKAGILLNDGWGEIINSYHDYAIDSQNPRVEVIIEEVER